MLVNCITQPTSLAGPQPAASSTSRRRPLQLRTAPQQRCGLLQRRALAPGLQPARGVAAPAGTAVRLETARSFEELLAGDVPALVDFCTPWCGPCKLQSKVLDIVAPIVDGSVRLAKLDTEKLDAVAARFHIYSLPTLILFKQGEAVARYEGFMGEIDLRLWLKKNL